MTAERKFLENFRFPLQQISAFSTQQTELVAKFCYHVWKKVFFDTKFIEYLFFPSKRSFERKILSSVSGVLFLFLILPMTRRLRVLQSRFVGVLVNTYVCCATSVGSQMWIKSFHWPNFSKMI